MARGMGQYTYGTIENVGYRATHGSGGWDTVSVDSIHPKDSQKLKDAKDKFEKLKQSDPDIQKERSAAMSKLHNFLSKPDEQRTAAEKELIKILREESYKRTKAYVDEKNNNAPKEIRMQRNSLTGETRIIERSTAPRSEKDRRNAQDRVNAKRDRENKDEYKGKFYDDIWVDEGTTVAISKQSIKMQHDRVDMFTVMRESCRQLRGKDREYYSRMEKEYESVKSEIYRHPLLDISDHFDLQKFEEMIAVRRDPFKSNEQNQKELEDSIMKNGLANGLVKDNGQDPKLIAEINKISEEIKRKGSGNKNDLKDKKILEIKRVELIQQLKKTPRMEQLEEKIKSLEAERKQISSLGSRIKNVGSRIKNFFNPSGVKDPSTKNQLLKIDVSLEIFRKSLNKEYAIILQSPEDRLKDFVKKYATPSNIDTLNHNNKVFEGIKMDIRKIEDEVKKGYPEKDVFLHRQDVNPELANLAAEMFSNLDAVNRQTFTYQDLIDSGCIEDKDKAIFEKDKDKKFDVVFDKGLSGVFDIKGLEKHFSRELGPNGEPSVARREEFISDAASLTDIVPESPSLLSQVWNSAKSLAGLVVGAAFGDEEPKQKSPNASATDLIGIQFIKPETPKPVGTQFNTAFGSPSPPPTKKVVELGAAQTMFSPSTEDPKKSKVKLN